MEPLCFSRDDSLCPEHCAKSVFIGQRIQYFFQMLSGVAAGSFLSPADKNLVRVMVVPVSVVVMAAGTVRIMMMFPVVAVRSVVMSMLVIAAAVPFVMVSVLFAADGTDFCF